MDVSDNPYESPSPTGANVRPTVTGSTLVIILLAKTSFWLGLALALLGYVITFYPGSECSWFLTSALLIAPGLFVPKRTYQIVAIIACSLCLLFAYSGYHRGINYQKWLQTRPTQNTHHDPSVHR